MKIVKNQKIQKNSTGWNDFYYLDKKEQNCYDNDFLENADKLFYVACIKTNEGGTACEKCIKGYKLNDEGYCVDTERYVEIDEEGNCIKCKDDDIEDERYYCTKSIYGCVQTFLEHYIKCENLTNISLLIVIYIHAQNAKKDMILIIMDIVLRLKI